MTGCVKIIYVRYGAIDGLGSDVAVRLAECLPDASKVWAMINGPLGAQAACYRVPE